MLIKCVCVRQIAVRVQGRDKLYRGMRNYQFLLIFGAPSAPGNAWFFGPLFVLTIFEREKKNELYLRQVASSFVRDLSKERESRRNVKKRKNTLLWQLHRIFDTRSIGQFRRTFLNWFFFRTSSKSELHRFCTKLHTSRKKVI